MKETEIRNFLHENGWQPTGQGNFKITQKFARNRKARAKIRNLRVKFSENLVELEIQSLFDTSWMRVAKAKPDDIMHTRRGIVIGGTELLDQAAVKNI